MRRRLLRVCCLVLGHDVARAKDLRPEHDFCLWCHKPMPHRWVRPA